MRKFDLLNLLAMLCACLFFISCSGNDGEGDEPGGNGGGTNPEGKLVLSASASFINNDGRDAAVFTVRMGDTDITDKAKIYLGNDVFAGTSFTTTKVGDYTFFASYEGEISDKITIKAIAGIPDIPDDPQADKFDGFVHRVLVVQSTGTWCQYCPYMTAGIKSYLESDANTGDAVFAAAHNGDVMANDYSDAVNQWLSVSGYPTLSLNLDSRNKVQHQGEPAATASSISGAVSNTLRDAVHVAISASVSGTENSGILTVRARVKIGADGKYRIAAWLLEDGIRADQVNSTGLTDKDNFSIHNNVLRISSAASAYGVQLGENASSTKGSVKEYVCTLNLADAKVASLAKCRVVIFVTAPKDGKFTVNNVITCPINNSVAFEYE